MGRRTSCLVVAFLIVFISLEAVIADPEQPKMPVKDVKEENKDKPQKPVEVDPIKDQKPADSEKDKPNPEDKNKVADKDGSKDKPTPDDKSKDADKNKPKPEENKGDKDKPKPEENKGDKDKPTKPEADDYDDVWVLPTGQEKVKCKLVEHCKKKYEMIKDDKDELKYGNITCPQECPSRKPSMNKKQKACFIDCGAQCEPICKWRKPKCEGYGSLCYDPRFVGGDGVMFYFHGQKGGNFAVVSDDNLHINAHFIGSRPQGRTRDYTWVQALSVMFDTHTLVLAAKRVSQWDDKVDALIVRWDGKDIIIPTEGEAELRFMTEEREVVIERTDDTNTVKLTVAGLLELNVRVTPIGEEENRVHNYQLPAGDAFAHLETQFKFINPTDLIEGILGKTYQPGYVSPVDRRVRMPMMGGEEKYQTSSLYSTVCNACRFQRQSEVPAIGLAKY